tara:strand:+ start:2260 stop:2703 length:444 start_codon:yes stop_codon:yes gene_type:complete
MAKRKKLPKGYKYGKPTELPWDHDSNPSKYDQENWEALDNNGNKVVYKMNGHGTKQNFINYAHHYYKKGGIVDLGLTKKDVEQAVDYMLQNGEYFKDDPYRENIREYWEIKGRKVKKWEDEGAYDDESAFSNSPDFKRLKNKTVFRR